MALMNAWFGKGIGKASGPDSVGYTWQQPFPLMRQFRGHMAGA